jgi:hypothetical protein
MSWLHLEDSTPKARKSHLCHLCNLPIAIGEVHVKRSGVGDNGMESIRMHEVCEKVTHGWDEDSWEYSEPCDFREELADYLKRQGIGATHV